MIVVINLIGRPRFFVRAAVGQGIGKAIGLAIDGAVLTEMEVVVGFFELSL